MKWSEAVTLEFVKIYLEHEILWNPDNVYYKSRNQRDKAYSKICTKFKESTSKSLTIPEVKMKIRNLRTTYQQQIHKILQKSSPDSIYEPTLVWFNEMDRCLKNISSRHSTIIPTMHETSEADSSSHIWVELDKKSQDSHTDPLFPQSDEDYDLSKSEDLPQNITDSQKKIKKKKLKKQNTDLNFSVIETDDEFDIYGKYIAAQLRKLNLKRALQLQLEIQRIISDARISNLDI